MKWSSVYIQIWTSTDDVFTQSSRYNNQTLDLNFTYNQLLLEDSQTLEIENEISWI